MWTCDVVAGADLDVAAVAELYRAATLAERRPVQDRPRFEAMLRNANLVVVARDGDRLVGIARSLTDGVYATYLCDIAVDVACQRRGVGRALVARTRAAAPRAKIVLLSAPGAVSYYPHIGFHRHDSAWVLDPLEP